MSFPIFLTVEHFDYSYKKNFHLQGHRIYGLRITVLLFIQLWGLFHPLGIHNSPPEKDYDLKKKILDL